MPRRMGLVLGLIAGLYACSAATPRQTRPPRAERLPCAGDAWVAVLVVDSVTRMPSRFGELSATGYACHGAVRTPGEPVLLGPLPASEHELDIRVIGGVTAPKRVRLVAGDTVSVTVAVEPQRIEIAGSETRPDRGTVQPPDSITLEWLTRYASPGCFHGCDGPFYERIWRQIGGRADARAALLELVEAPYRSSLQRDQGVLFLSRLRPPPYDVLARHLAGEDSTLAYAALWRVCTARADSMIANERLIPFDRRIGCGAPIARAAPGVIGTYAGEFPCSDCDAARIELSLDTAGTYRLRREYVGLGEPSIGLGTWLPADRAPRIHLIGDDDFSWELIVIDSTTLVPIAPDGERLHGHALSRTSRDAAPSHSPCRIGRHVGGTVEVVVPLEPLPEDARVRTTADGCVAPLQERTYRQASGTLGPLPAGAHEVVLEAAGRVLAVDTIHAYAGHRTFDRVGDALAPADP